MEGWIKLHRRLLQSSVWREADAEGKVILVTLLLRACHAVTQWRVNSGKTVLLQPGDVWISYRHFAKACGVTLKKAQSEIKRLTAAGFLSCASTREGTVVRIMNWELYQQADTPKGTAPGTPADTALSLDAGGFPALADTPKDTASDTPADTRNKIYINIKNKLNKTDLNKKLLAEAAEKPEYLLALQEYAEAFPVKDAALDDGTRQTLQFAAASAGAVWVLKAVRELKAVCAEKQVRSPQRYLLGIITNWYESGFPNDRRAEQKRLLDFYKQEGVI